MHEAHMHHIHQSVTPSALLKHMAEHNQSHIEELKAVAEKLPADAKAQVLAAAETIAAGNDQLLSAIKALGE